jgi:hypothetical protein|tara:strand:+ start:521 stop:940 length:420 start_codon:yes stop_codon:yes gene_type:complete
MANSINLDTAERLDITCRRGDSFALDLDVTDSSGTALNMSGYNFIMEVRTADTINTEDLTNSAIILSTEDTGNSNNKLITHTTASQDLTAGDVVFSITAANMKGVVGGAYVYDIQAVDGTGKVSTWLFGAFIVNEDVSV